MHPDEVFWIVAPLLGDGRGWAARISIDLEGRAVDFGLTVDPHVSKRPEVDNTFHARVPWDQIRDHGLYILAPETRDGVIRFVDFDPAEIKFAAPAARRRGRPTYSDPWLATAAHQWIAGQPQTVVEWGHSLGVSESQARKIRARLKAEGFIEEGTFGIEQLSEKGRHLYPTRED